jgi:4-amino-4-deoxy-L-arabinose transferase-like glycosyltransferase
MFIILPIIAFIILLFIFLYRSNDWRISFILSACIWGLLITAITETLSSLKLITLSGLLVAWLLINLILGFIYWLLIKQGKQDLLPKENPQLPIFLKLLLGSIVFIVCVVALIALLAPPNNWDSMTYHMARSMHWIQNHSVDHYPAHYLPQLYLMPWSEFAITHFQILGNGDRFANLIQWFSMIGSIVGVSLVAKELGADIRGQIFAGVFCATIPMGILQGSSTQTDYVVSFWLVCLVYYILLVVKEPINWKYAFLIGTSLGLALLTKGTAYIYAFPFMVWLLVVSLQKIYWKKLWKPFLIIALLALFLNLGYYTRNFDLFGSLFGSTQGFESTDDPQGFKYTNDAYSLPILISNVVRNLGLHADIVRNLGIQGVISPTTGATEKVIQIIHKVLGVDISDPRTTRHGPFIVPGLSTNEDTAGNPLHLFIILLSIGLLLCWPKLKKQRYLLIYTLAIVVAFLLFCFQLKWQPYHSRLHLPLFVLFAAGIGVVLSQIPRCKIANAIAALLIVTSLHWGLYNKNRPLIGNVNIFNQSRVEQYFIDRDYLQDPYTKMADFVDSTGCSKIGLLLEDHWEYPLWILLQKDNKRRVQFEHVNVKNVSNLKANVTPYKNFIPCAILYKENHAKNKNKSQLNLEIVVKNRVYTRSWSATYVSVYRE